MGTAISYWEELKRKTVHLSSLWMVAAILLIPDWRITSAFFAILLAGTLIVEHRYALGRKDPFSRLYHWLFGRMLREVPRPGSWVVSGGAPVLAAALMVTLLFSRIPAAGALAVMLLGDAFAALIGRRFGRHPAVNGKSWEGSIAFVVFGCLGACAVGGFGNAAPGYWFAVLPAALAGALVELFQKQLIADDNFTIPLAAGAVLQFFPLAF